MIDIKDLRIGNKVFNCDNDIVTVMELRDDFYMAEPGGQFYSTSNGIPLTPELLEKCGFEKEEIDLGNKTENGYSKGVMIMLPAFDGKIWYAAPYGYPLNANRTLYLHQLQNLYYTLTGQEININLKK